MGTVPQQRGEPMVRVIEKASNVLDAFTPERPSLQLSEIRRITGLPATTVARIVRTLVDGDLLTKEADQHRIGLRVLAWTASANAGSGLVEAAQPIISELCDSIGETIGVYVRHGNTRVAVATVISSKAIVYRGYVGQVMPLHVGAAGKVLMAFDSGSFEVATSGTTAPLGYFSQSEKTQLRRQLNAVREQGWAFAEEEREVGLNSLAAPVFGSTGGVVAAIAVGGPSFRLTANRSRSLGLKLVIAANMLSNKIGFLGQIDPSANVGSPK